MNEHPAAFHDRWKKRGRAIDREWEEERDERMRGGNGRQRGRQGGEERERENPYGSLLAGFRWEDGTPSRERIMNRTVHFSQV